MVSVAPEKWLWSDQLAGLSPQQLAEQRAEYGQRFLDAKLPGWFLNPEFDDLSTLDISKTHLCVVGKLFSGYTQGCAKIGVTDVTETALGFYAEDCTQATYRLLTDAHRAGITRRRAKHASAN